MSIAVEQAYLAAVRSDAMVFLKQAFATVYPGKELLGNWHINAILAGLEDSFQGKAPRLIINLPPRYLKSFMVSVAWPAFVLGLDPSAKIICISYSDELAKPLSRDFRRIVESTWYRKIFPNVKLAKVTEGEVVTEMGGSRYATTVNGTLTGRGADFIIIDDPIKPEEAWSDKARESVNEWFRSTLLSRLDDKQRSVLILVMQRLHVNDLTGYVEAGGGFGNCPSPRSRRKLNPSPYGMARPIFGWRVSRYTESGMGWKALRERAMKSAPTTSPRSISNRPKRQMVGCSSASTLISSGSCPKWTRVGRCG